MSMKALADEIEKTPEWEVEAILFNNIDLIVEALRRCPERAPMVIPDTSHLEPDRPGL